MATLRPCLSDSPAAMNCTFESGLYPGFLPRVALRHCPLMFATHGRGGATDSGHPVARQFSGEDCTASIEIEPEFRSNTGLTWFREARFREREMKRAGNSLTIQLREKLILCLGEFHGCGAFFVVVSHRIDSSAYRIAPRQPSIVRSQQFGRRTHIPHPRIEP